MAAHRHATAEREKAIRRARGFMALFIAGVVISVILVVGLPSVSSGLYISRSPVEASTEVQRFAQPRLGRDELLT